MDAVDQRVTQAHNVMFFGKVYKGLHAYVRFRTADRFPIGGSNEY